MQLCLYRATGLWHRGVGHGFGHGFGLGTGFFSLKGETKKAREFALLLLHMNRVSLVWRFPGIAFVHLSSWEVVGSLT